ncbi:MAG: biotin--[acetyl-CoA-carboxylase] ligase, partial [Chitinophagaceae bacterium]
MAKVRTGLAKHGDGYFAMAQVQGKGQRGKAWLTDPGTNIILTLVLNTSGLQLAQQFLFNAAIALGIHDFFAANAGDETTIKWPNDIYWRDRKAAGLLIENIIGGKDPRT